MAKRRPLQADLLADCPAERMPAHLEPMKAKPSLMPNDQSLYAFEYKWDGLRAIAYCDAKKLLVESRNLLDVTAQYPELLGLVTQVGSRPVVLDGEIVALDEKLRPNFGMLQHRMHLTNAAAILRLVHEVPVFMMIFDVLHLDGRSTRSLPYLRRRELLESLGLAGANWQVPPYTIGDGSQMFQAAKNLDLEGVLAKRLDSVYEPGRRSDAWLKVKLARRQEFVIGGWTPGKGQFTGSLGAILVGCYDIRPEEAVAMGRPQQLNFAGAVGTGFTAAVSQSLLRAFGPLQIERSPFAQGNVKKPANYVKPIMLAEVEFTEWTTQGILRQPAFKGLRSDKDPRDVVRET